jgi:hypothetical protein
LAVKRFQRIGVVQPDSIVEQASEPPSAARVQTRFQVAGFISKEIPVEASSREFDATLASAPLFDNMPSLQQQTISDPTSRQDGTTGLDRQSTTQQPWGGRSITYSPTTQTVISTARREAATVVERKGAIATFPQQLRNDIITTVVRGYPGVAIPRYGGISISPLYWLDTDPQFEAPVGKNKWGATASVDGTKWSYKPTYTQRFTLSVDGGLEWPAIIPYS